MKYISKEYSIRFIDLDLDKSYYFSEWIYYPLNISLKNTLNITFKEIY